MNNTNKKYQVFVSSTYVDLIKERQEIMNALLELDCIPAGMELFPAADEDQWSLIKGVIDECDYYIVVVAGRYGSIGPEGLSYTEMEYRYAIETEKPVIAFLHKEPDSIQLKFTEKMQEGQNKLDEFRKLTQQKVCKFWTTPSELGSIVSRSLILLQKKHPSIGWVRGDQIANSEASSEILRLRRKIEELETETSKIEPPKGVESLACGDDIFTVNCTFSIIDETNKDNQEYHNSELGIEITWNELFYDLSPLMMNEAHSGQLKRRFTNLLEKHINNIISKSEKFNRFSNATFIDYDDSYFETSIIQLNALGLIVQSIKNRGVNNNMDYWTLSPYGQSVMNKLRAIKKEDQ